MRVPLLSLKRAVRSISAGEFFETNEKMVLINDDQCGIADIVLDGWLFEKKMNHSSAYWVENFGEILNSRSRFQTIQLFKDNLGYSDP